METGQAGSASVIGALWRGLVRWEDRWMLRRWAWVPIGLVGVSIVLTESKPTDVYDKAISSQTFAVEGKIVFTSNRNRSLKIVTSKSEIGVFCTYVQAYYSKCLSGLRPPFYAKFTLFEYRTNFFILISANDVKTGSVLVERRERLEQIKRDDDYFKNTSLYDKVWPGLVMSVLLTPLFMGAAFQKRRLAASRNVDTQTHKVD